MSIAEAELLRSAQNGDDLAFGHLVEPYLDPSYRMATRILGGRPEAEDAVQEALYRAWRALPSFRRDAKFSTWLYRIVWRVCVDMAPKRETVGLDPEIEGSSGEWDPEQRWEVVERQSEIEQALKDLSVPYRTVLALYYVEDLPVRVIAEFLELPVGTVKTHLHRARKALRARLSGLDHDGKKG